MTDKILTDSVDLLVTKEDFIGLFDLMDRLDPDKMKFTFKARWD